MISNKKKIYLIAEYGKLKKIIKEKKIRSNQVVDPKDFEKLLVKINKGKIIIDQKSCSIFYENLLRKKFKIIKNNDPIYSLKSIKNKKEIKHMKKCHIYDGVALTKFLYWLK